ncbi:hypothetical protein SDC9_06398 [bioreactor metagenome]|uniref:Uncharacterized protein n=1 Tax=bioreactor metagenome TaxID=1076179 RepID=A0A644T1T7_9ZZZZ
MIARREVRRGGSVRLAGDGAPDIEPVVDAHGDAAVVVLRLEGALHGHAASDGDGTEHQISSKSLMLGSLSQKAKNWQIKKTAFCRNDGAAADAPGADHAARHAAAAGRTGHAGDLSSGNEGEARRRVAPQSQSRRIGISGSSAGGIG